MKNEIKNNFSTHIQLSGRLVGPGQPILIIAEAGVSHFGDLQKAMDLVDLAVEAGADVFKTQAFQTDEMISNALPEWKDRLRIKEVNFDFISKIKQRCDDHGIIFLCTPHDNSVLPWLEELNVSAIKIGSGERGNIPFLYEISKLNKPVILSTGMYTHDDVIQALNAFDNFGLEDLALLHCVTCYPTPYEDVNMKIMEQIATYFSGPIGYSDHTKGHEASIVAASMGAHIIEKHITLDYDIPNAQDWKVSCGPNDFSGFVQSIRNTEIIKGTGGIVEPPCEGNAYLWATKSIVSNKALPAGHRLTKDDISFKRAGKGISPSNIKRVVGRLLKKSICHDEKIQWKDLV